MFRLIDAIGKRCIAYPLMFTGAALTHLSRVLLIAAAWILNIPIPEDDAER